MKFQQKCAACFEIKTITSPEDSGCILVCRGEIGCRHYLCSDCASRMMKIHNKKGDSEITKTRLILLK